MFNLFKKKYDPIEQKALVTDFLSLILNNEKLSMPVYVHDIETEQDAEEKEILPLIYLWNENRENNSFSLSVNGKIVGYLLEPFCSREHPQFAEIRDETMRVLSIASQKAVVSACEESGGFPSELF